jgi:CDP-glucose 4,6-dehydratase
LDLSLGFWRNKRVLVTGHSGLKGGWISLLLNKLDAKVYGLSLPPIYKPNLFEAANIESISETVFFDLRNIAQLGKYLETVSPEIVIHMAAQPLVRASYADPITTLQTNIIGTANLFEGLRNLKSVKAIINVTSDKCYRNDETGEAFLENAPLGGKDPYSGSKACAEIITEVYRSSYFSKNGVGLASARAGNVIGGGDWSEDRLVPDFMRALKSQSVLSVRFPNAIRPWQHSLDSVFGYLILAEKLSEDSEKYAEAWNFAPSDSSVTVSEVLSIFNSCFEKPLKWQVISNEGLGEAKTLRLNSKKAESFMKWKPKLDVESAIRLTAKWYRDFFEGKDMVQVSNEQVDQYLKLKSAT